MWTRGGGSKNPWTSYLEAPYEISCLIPKDESAAVESTTPLLCVERDGLRPAAHRNEGGGFLDEFGDLEGATDVAGGKREGSDSHFGVVFNGGVTTR